jgi:hypothetical protein
MGGAVSRLYDRARYAGVRAATKADFLLLSRRAESDDEIDWIQRGKQLALLANLDFVPSAEEVRALYRSSEIGLSLSVADEHIDKAALESAIVIVGDEVGEYVTSLVDVDMTSECGVIAPPFENFWIEFRAKNELKIESWGLLFSVHDAVKEPELREGDRWVLQVDLVIETRKGDMWGPGVRYLVPVQADGCMSPGDSDGTGSLFGQVASCARTDESDLGGQALWAGTLNRYLFAGLLTLSFMHCKNVDVVEIAPPPALSRKHEKRTGLPLVTYKTLDISPMRKVLDSEGGAQTNGLRKAMHICRGHFKSYTAEAPLFGRHQGTYWWADRIRGDQALGRIEKDYAVRLDPDSIGRSYREAGTDLPAAKSFRGGDPDLSGRGLIAHNQLQNHLAEVVRLAGHEPLSPRPSEPQYDLAWIAANEIWIVEVKSLTAVNELSQMHQAIGQVTDYAHRIEPGPKIVRKAIAVEQQPRGAHWFGLLRDQGIVLAWPTVFEQLFAADPSAESR